MFEIDFEEIEGWLIWKLTYFIFFGNNHLLILFANIKYKPKKKMPLQTTTKKDKSGEKQSHETRLINSVEESGFNVNPLEQSYPH